MPEDWVKPIENSIDGIRQGMIQFDGVEFDLRLTTDGELVLFHDNHLSKAQRQQIGGSKWTEDHTSDELAELGIPLFDELLSNDVFTNAWREHGKVRNRFTRRLPISGMAGCSWATGHLTFARAHA